MLSQREIDVIRAYRSLSTVERRAVDELLLNNRGLLIRLIGQRSEGIQRIVEAARAQSVNQLPLNRT